MKIALAAPQSYRPNVLLSELSEHSGRRTPLNPPLGLLHVATSLAPHHDVSIADAQLNHLTVSALAEAVLAGSPDVVGVSVNFTTLISKARELAAALKRARPQLLIVAGGNCATFMNRWFCDVAGFDAVFLHEADRTFATFVQRLEHGDPWSTPGITFRHPDGFISTNPFPGYIEDLDKLPTVRYDLLPERQRYVATVVASRGCSFNCIYCSTKTMWKRWRFRSPGNVLREIDALYGLGYRSTLAFCDDEFMSRRSRVLEIARLIEERGYGYEWGIAGRVELADDEVLDALSRGGCQQIFFGIESGSDEVRRKLKRRLTAREIEETVDRCRRHGILPIVSFMVGIPYETRDDALATLALMERVNTYKVQLSVFTPLPGTPVFENPGRFGIRLNENAFDFSRVNIDVGTVVHSTEHLTESEIRELWYDGQGIVTKRYSTKDTFEAANRRVRSARVTSDGPSPSVPRVPSPGAE